VGHTYLVIDFKKIVKVIQKLNDSCERNDIYVCVGILSRKIVRTSTIIGVNLVGLL
jgi:hypothetical protein